MYKEVSGSVKSVFTLAFDKTHPYFVKDDEG
jgi:hypothetical protein